MGTSSDQVQTEAGFDRREGKFLSRELKKKLISLITFVMVGRGMNIYFLLLSA